MEIKYKYSDIELKELLKSMVILVDTREQENRHIIDYFDEKKIPYRSTKLDYGDYSCLLPANSNMGILRDIYFNGQVVIERKGGLEELSGNFTKDRSRIEEEFTRAKGKVILLIEDGSFEAILEHKYNTQYAPASFIATLKTFESRYGVQTNFITKQCAGSFIYATLYYFLREQLI